MSVRPPPPRPTVHFQGRARELQTLLAALARYPVVLITGLAGIGKTTLAARLASELAAPPAPVDSPPEVPEAASGAPPDERAPVAERRSAAPRRRTPKPPPPPAPLWMRVRPDSGGDGLLADLAKLFDLTPSAEDDVPARSLAVLGALERHSASSVSGAPAVLFVDDLHLADDPSGRALLTTLLRYARNARLVGTARSAPEVPAIEDLEVFTLPLSGLDETEAVALLFSVLGEAKQQEVATLASSLYRRTAGHPHFLKLLGSHLAARGIATMAAANEPAPMRELEEYLRREVVDRLPREELRALATLALLDGPVPTSLGEAAAGPLVKSWPRVVRSLVRRGLAEAGAGGMLDLHAQVREAALAGVAPRERAEIEARAGEELLARGEGEPAVLLAAYGHLVRAGQARRVADEIAELLDRAHRAGHLAAILALLDAIAREIGRLPPALAVHRARVLKLRGSYDAALAELTSLADEPPPLARQVHAEIGDVHNLSGDFEKARAHYEKALESAKAENDLAALVDCESNLASLFFYQGESASAERIYRKALGRTRELGDRAREAMTLNNLAAVLRKRCKLREAEELYRECLAIDEATGDRTGSARTVHNLGVVYMTLDRPADAVREFGRSLELKEKLGVGPGMANTLRHLAEVTLAAGDTQAARAHLDRAATYLGRGDRLLGAALEGTRAMIELEEGSTTRARETLSRAVAACSGSSARRVQSGLYRRLAEVAIAAGEAGEAREHCRRCLALQTAMDETFDLVRSHRLAAHAALMDQDRAAARHELVAAMAALPPEGLIGDRAWLGVLEIAAQVAEGAKDLAPVREQVAQVARLGDVPAHLAARRLLAAALMVAGQENEARGERARILELARPGQAPGKKSGLALLAKLETTLDRLVPNLPSTFVLADVEGERPAGSAEVATALSAAGSRALVLDVASETLTVRGTPIPGFFAKKVQVALLAALMRAGPRAMTKSALYEAAWKARYNAEFHDNTLYVRINQLRKILEPLVGADPIQTQPESATYRIAPGLDYLLVAPS